MKLAIDATARIRATNPAPLLFLFLAACAGGAPSGSSPAGAPAPFTTPGLDEVWPEVADERRESLRRAAASFPAQGTAVPADEFSPGGPNVTVHVARATRSWLADAALFPSAVDAFLANERNFFPFCTICAGVRLAFSDYRDSLARRSEDSPVRAWLSELESSLEAAQLERLKALQSDSESLAPMLAGVYRAYVREGIADPEERRAFVEAARRMDEYTTEVAREGLEPGYEGAGCPLCRAAADAG